MDESASSSSLKTELRRRKIDPSDCVEREELIALARLHGLFDKQQEEEKPLCRICLDDEDITDMIHPCQCTGTQRWVHRSCLNHWRSAKPSAFYQCTTCKFHFKTRTVQEHVSSLDIWKFRMYLLADILIAIFACIIPMHYMRYVVIHGYDFGWGLYFKQELKAYGFTIPYFSYFVAMVYVIFLLGFLLLFLYLTNRLPDDFGTEFPRNIFCVSFGGPVIIALVIVVVVLVVFVLFVKTTVENRSKERWRQTEIERNEVMNV